MARPNPKVKFQDVLDALLDIETPFPPMYLPRFSDLSPEKLAALAKVWGVTPLERRRALMDDLEELADADPLQSFEELGRMALVDLDAPVRVSALRLMWASENQRDAPVFIRMMTRDPDVGVRVTAARLLGAHVFYGELEEIPEDLYDTIHAALMGVVNGSDEADVRSAALESLGFSGRGEVAGLIDQAYNNTDPAWVESAINAMGRSADESYAPKVLAYLGSLRESLQEAAVRAAGELGIKEARQPLLELLKQHEGDDMWAATIWSLSQIGGEGVREVLEGLMEESEDEEADLLEEALENLSFTDDFAAFDLLDVDAAESSARIVDLEHGEEPVVLPEQDEKPKRARQKKKS